MKRWHKLLLGFLGVGIASAAPLAIDLTPTTEIAARKIQVLGNGCYEEASDGTIMPLSRPEYDGLGQPGGRPVFKAWCGLLFDTPRSTTKKGDYYDYNGETYYRIGESGILKAPQGSMPNGVQFNSAKNVFTTQKSLKELITLNEAGAITLDTTRAAEANSSLTLTYAATVNSPATKLIVQVETWAAGGTTASVTFNGTNLTSATAQANAGVLNYASIWYLDNPTVGTYNVVVTSTSGTPFERSAATSLIGAASGGADSTAGGSFSAASNGLTTNITTNATNAWIFDSILVQNNGMTATSPQIDNADPNDRTSRSSYKKDPGVGGVKTMAWTWSGNEDGVNAVAAFAPASTVPATLLLQNSTMTIQNGTVTITAPK